MRKLPTDKGSRFGGWLGTSSGLEKKYVSDAGRYGRQRNDVLLVCEKNSQSFGKFGDVDQIGIVVQLQSTQGAGELARAG